MPKKPPGAIKLPCVVRVVFGLFVLITLFRPIYRGPLSTPIASNQPVQEFEVAVGRFHTASYDILDVGEVAFDEDHGSSKSPFALVPSDSLDLHLSPSASLEATPRDSP